MATTEVGPPITMKLGETWTVYTGTRSSTFSGTGGGAVLTASTGGPAYQTVLTTVGLGVCTVTVTDVATGDVYQFDVTVVAAQVLPYSRYVDVQQV